MKTGQIFWGTALISAGSLILLVRYDALNVDWNFIWNLWPLYFVFWGLSLLTKQSSFRPFIALLFGLFTGIFSYGIINMVYDNDFVFDEDGPEYRVERFTEEYDPGINTARLEVNSGAGKFYIRKSTGDLVKGIARGNYADYFFKVKKAGDNAEINFDYTKNIRIFDGKLRNTLEIRLHRSPLWNLELNLGAAKSHFDLSDFKIKKIELNAGAASTYFKLGNLYEDTRLNVEMGAAELELEIPENTGCKISGEMVLVLTDLPGFIKAGEDYYISENYEESTNKIFLHIETGVSSIKIKRYKETLLRNRN